MVIFNVYNFFWATKIVTRRWRSLVRRWPWPALIAPGQRSLHVARPYCPWPALITLSLHLARPRRHSSAAGIRSVSWTEQKPGRNRLHTIATTAVPVWCVTVCKRQRAGDRRTDGLTECDQLTAASRAPTERPSTPLARMISHYVTFPLE